MGLIYVSGKKAFREILKEPHFRQACPRAMCNNVRVNMTSVRLPPSCLVAQSVRLRNQSRLWLIVRVRIELAVLHMLLDVTFYQHTDRVDDTTTPQRFKLMPYCPQYNEK